VDVVEGVVTVQHALLPTDRAATLRAGESIRVYKNVQINQNQLDKGTILRYAFNILREAGLMLSSRGGKITLPGGGGGAPGDTCKPGTAGCGGAAPPPPPPPGPVN
jgi:hypothetical protein